MRPNIAQTMGANFLICNCGTASGNGVLNSATNLPMHHCNPTKGSKAELVDVANFFRKGQPSLDSYPLAPS